MSSPYIMPHAGYAEHDAGSPALSPLSPTDQLEPSLRPMRLKVLYSSDAENKTNCLAKWPEILNIRTAYLDEKTQVGVIELKTCIQAIVAASPELDCKYGQDYTIYAYDYSEYETPLVGQGMLSRALAAISSNPIAPAHESDTIVTGRVCKTPLGLFGNGVHEVLEVKLRLVPVPTRLQPQYVESMKQQRDLNHTVPEGCDPRVWQEFLQQNPGMLAVLGQNRTQQPGIGAMSQHGIEHVQRLVSEGYRPQSARTASYAGSIASGASNRSGSPTPSLQSMGPTQSFAGNPRSMSRTSDRGGAARSSRASVSASTEFTYDDARAEEGPQRKRAKLTKADHPGKSRLGKPVDSLRVTASAAASVRVLQPSAVRPPLEVMHLEGAPRAPTPTPGSGVPRRRGALKPVRSGLGQEQILTSDSGYKSLASDDGSQLADSRFSSPDDVAVQSDYNSPEEMASSPPMFRNPAASFAPSSPVLPAMPALEHSISGTLEDPFTESGAEILPWIDEGTKFIAPHATTVTIPGRAGSAAGIGESFRSDLSQTEVEEQLEEEAKQKGVSMKNARSAIGLRRSQTWSGDQPSSDPAGPGTSPPGEADIERPSSQNSKSRAAWNKEKRKAAMQSKLNESIEAGEMPPFCVNCGAIETPTWRKAWTRVYSGEPKDLRPMGKYGAILFVQVLKFNDDGTSRLFKVYRKSIPPGQEGYDEVIFCNPCGLWLSTHKAMRPETHWGNKKAKSDKPRDRRSRSKKQQDKEDSDQPEPTGAPSEAMGPNSEISVDPKSQPAGDGMELDVTDAPSHQILTENNPLTVSDVPEGPGLNPNDIAALERAIQASPGMLRKSPRQIEKHSSDPARRTLFPSPKSDGPLGVSIEDKARASKEAPKTFNERRGESAEKSPSDGESAASQNEEAAEKPDVLPATPSKKSDASALRMLAVEMKTPLLRKSPANAALTTGDFFSSAAKAYLHAPHTPSRTPSRNLGDAGATMGERLTPFGRNLNQLLADVQADGKNDLDDLILPPLVDRTTPGRAFSHVFDFGDYSSDLPNFPSSPGWFDLQDGRYDEATLGTDWKAIFDSAEKSKSEPNTMQLQGEEGAASAATEAEQAKPSS